MTTRKNYKILSLLLCIIFIPTYIGASYYDGPIIDAHLHINNPDDVSKIQSQMQMGNIEYAISMPTPGSPMRLGRDYSNIFELCDGQFVKNSWLASKYRDKECFGFGEVGLRHYNKSKKERKVPSKQQQTIIKSFNDKSIFEYLDANTYKKPVVIHIEPYYDIENIDNLVEVKDFYESICKKYPETNFIAAHTGMMSPENLEELFSICPNLYSDFKVLIGERKLDKFRDLHMIHDTDINLKNEWINSFKKYPNRFLFGSDGKTGYLGKRTKLIKKYASKTNRIREIFSSLSIELQRKLFYENAKIVFGID